MSDLIAQGMVKKLESQVNAQMSGLAQGKFTSVCIPTQYTCTGTVTNIPIGSTQFNSATDKLFVRYNSIYPMSNPTNYTINANGTSIDLVGWSAVSGDIFDFDIYKNYNVTQLPLFVTVPAVSNTYTLDLSNNMNFEITTNDSVAKTIVFSNVPQGDNVAMTIEVGLTYTNSATINFPASVVWKDGLVPTFTAGKYYELIFISKNKGVTWRGSAVGTW